MDFGQPNVKISWKMANGQLLFLALNNNKESDMTLPHGLCIITTYNYMYIRVYRITFNDVI